MDKVLDISVLPAFLLPYSSCTVYHLIEKGNAIYQTEHCARANMGDLEHARVSPFVPDVFLSARGSEVATQTKESPLC